MHTKYPVQQVNIFFLIILLRGFMLLNCYTISFIIDFPRKILPKCFCSSKQHELNNIQTIFISQPIVLHGICMLKKIFLPINSNFEGNIKTH